MYRRLKPFALFVLFLVTFAALACVPGGGGRRMEEVRDHWEDTVALEDTVESEFAFIVQSTNEGFMQIRTEYPLAEECFENSGEVIQDAVSGRYDNTALDGNANDEAPSGNVNGVAIGQALAVVENYPGDIERCQEMIQKIADDITVWRQSRINEFRHLWDLKQDLDTQYQGELYRSLFVDLGQYAEERAREAGIPVPDYIYPTFHLEVVSKDREICDYYGTEWNSAFDQCRLSGQGAYDYIFRPFVSAEVQESFDSGNDDLNPLEPADEDGRNQQPKQYR
jgi:hypothetical protein